MENNLPNVPVEKVSSTKPEKKKSGNLVIKILAGLLILVVLSELAYLLYNNYYKPTQESITGPSLEEIQEISKPDSTETPDSDQTQPLNFTGNISRTAFNTAINAILDNNLQYKNVVLSFTIEGNITKLTKTTQSYGAQLQIAQKNGDYFGLRLIPKEILQSRIRDITNNTDISLDDLKVGDYISLSITSSFINNPDLESKIFIDKLE